MKFLFFSSFLQFLLVITSAGPLPDSIKTNLDSHEEGSIDDDRGKVQSISLDRLNPQHLPLTQKDDLSITQNPSFDRKNQEKDRNLPKIPTDLGISGSIGGGNGDLDEIHSQLIIDKMPADKKEWIRAKMEDLDRPLEREEEKRVEIRPSANPPEQQKTVIRSEIVRKSQINEKSFQKNPENLTEPTKSVDLTNKSTVDKEKMDSSEDLEENLSEIEDIDDDLTVSTTIFTPISTTVLATNQEIQDKLDFVAVHVEENVRKIDPPQIKVKSENPRIINPTKVEPIPSVISEEIPARLEEIDDSVDKWDIFFQFLAYLLINLSETTKNIENQPGFDEIDENSQEIPSSAINQELDVISTTKCPPTPPESWIKGLGDVVDGFLSSLNCALQNCSQVDEEYEIREHRLSKDQGESDGFIPRMRRRRSSSSSSSCPCPKIHPKALRSFILTLLNELERS